jgi:hypothetical protein
MTEKKLWTDTKILFIGRMTNLGIIYKIVEWKKFRLRPRGIILLMLRRRLEFINPLKN